MLNIKKNFSLHKLLLLYCTFGWLVINILAAKIPDLAVFFVAVRDSWVFIFLAILFSSRKRHGVALSIALICLFVLGGIGFVEGGVAFTDVLIYFYGLRDLCLIGLVFYVLTLKNISIPNSYIYVFVYLVAALFFIEVISQLLGFEEQYKLIFNLDGYFQAKGVAITLDGGIFGYRPSLPLYSPGLIAELLAGFILLQMQFYGRWILFALSLITLSKVALFYLVLRVFKKFYLLIFIGGVLSIPLLSMGLERVKEAYPNSLVSQHANSVIEHVSPHHYITPDDFTLLPDRLGSSSIVASLLKGVDSSRAPESMLIGRFLDYNLLSILFVLLLIWMCYQLQGERRFLFLVFLGLQVLTGMANHPVGFLPIIYFAVMNNKST